jgi:uncharacterized alkaline shock family protein YloU
MTWTIQQLSDYLDAGRRPADPEIDHDAEAQAVLAALERLRTASRDLLERDARTSAPTDEAWFDELMETVTRESRAGRTIPYPQYDPQTELETTEGAVRALIRAVGDGIPGILVGRVALHGDLVESGGRAGTVVVEVTVSLRWGVASRTAVDELRTAVAETMVRHTPLTPSAVDIVVADVHVDERTAAEHAAADRTDAERIVADDGTRS